MNERFSISDTGIVFVPRYVRQVSDMEYGSVVSHENYNEKLNLNSTQGDYNTEILKLLFTKENPAEVPHIKYLDKIITDEVNRIDDRIDAQQVQIDETIQLVEQTREELSDLSLSVTNIINGVTKVGKAVTADRIAGVENVGDHRYYGTDYAGNVGFHEMPEALYARDMSSHAVEIDGIYFTPRTDSITEAMLVEDLRTKINRETISDYDLLLNRPRINNVLLTGNVALSTLGVQPAGNYLTEVPSEYATKTYVNNTVAPYLLASTASNTYATKTSLNTTNSNLSSLTTTVNNHATYAEGRYARVCVGSFSGTPKTGDILINL